MKNHVNCRVLHVIMLHTEAESGIFQRQIQVKILHHCAVIDQTAQVNSVGQVAQTEQLIIRSTLHRNKHTPNKRCLSAVLKPEMLTANVETILNFGSSINIGLKVKRKGIVYIPTDIFSAQIDVPRSANKYHQFIGRTDVVVEPEVVVAVEHQHGIILIRVIGGAYVEHFSAGKRKCGVRRK